MNIVRMEQTLFWKYLTDEKFIKSQLLRFVEWFYRYSFIGETAFNEFIVETSEGVVCGFTTEYSDEKKQPYEIVLWLAFPGHTETPMPFKYSEPSIVNGMLHVTSEIPENNSQWGRYGIRTVSDLDEKSQQYLTKLSLPAITLFSKIQNDALKCQKKIIRIIKKHDELIEHSKDGAKKHQSKEIMISPGISYIYASESERRSFIRKCEAWSVRGHYRHYKNGKVVYIRPHTKGQGRLKNTTYAVKGGD